MNVMACAGNNMIVVRAFDSTVAAAHKSGTVILATVDAWHHNSVAAEVNAIETTLGANPSGSSGGTVSSLINSAFSYDSTFASAAAACASGKTVAVTKQSMWQNLATATCPSLLWFPTGTGVSVQPGSGQTFTMLCPSVSGSVQKIIDMSLGGSVVFSSGCGTPAPATWWGAVADTTSPPTIVTDNGAAVNAAISTLQPAGIALCFPSGGVFGAATTSYYGFSSSANILHSTNGQVWEMTSCAGQSGSTAGPTKGANLLFSAGSSLAFNGTSTPIFGIYIHDLGLWATSTGGDVISMSGTVGNVRISNNYIGTSNPAASLVKASTGASGDIDSLTFGCNIYTSAASHSVAQLWFVDANVGSTLENIMIDGCSNAAYHGSSTATAPAIQMDCGVGAVCSKHVIRDLLFEVSPGGIIQWNGVSNSLIESVEDADTTLAAPGILLQNTSSSQALDRITIINPLLSGGSASFPELKVVLNSGYPQAQVTVIGGSVPFTRSSGYSANYAPLEINTRNNDTVGYFGLFGVQFPAGLSGSGFQTQGALSTTTGGVYSNNVGILKDPTFGDIDMVNSSGTFQQVRGKTFSDASGLGAVTFDASHQVFTESGASGNVAYLADTAVHLSFIASSGLPSLTGCGTGAAITGTDQAGTVTLGTGTVTSCSVGFTKNYVATPSCTVSTASTTIFGAATSVSVSTLVAGFSSNLASGKFSYHCFSSN
jgi:hypothetical protein